MSPVGAPQAAPTTGRRTESSGLLEVEGLTLGLRRGKGRDVRIVEGVDLTVGAGQRVGLVGESGSGKSLTLRAIAGLLPAGVEVLGGGIRYAGQELTTMPDRRRRALAGPDIAMVFQEPMTALNPTTRVVDQIAEGPRRHLGLSASAARELAVATMARTGIPDPERRARAYPHELSGGLRQRIMIAMAVSCSPRLLLCDEPTTALDVTVQLQVLRLLTDLCDETGTALLFVTHDLAVVNQTCDDVSVMYAGHIVERGSVADTFTSPCHPYTRGLLESAPDFDRPDRQLVPIPGFPPNVADRSAGCPFAPRCGYVQDRCTHEVPPLLPVTGPRTPRNGTTPRESACFEVARLQEDPS
ncbi:ABC transporter ATP-binding protein [Lapillicoccus jejuensis]|uniref:Peptide/nickel transport system ATP-binding protein/dipeptide transport system ATP-binding protein/oligopeptide transport system ATP-binding protein n=1 Tax=Lapillicoccus jejuensis TaxID=402171 RepID=A0A542E3V6_9MICO|nr:ABC transporter ATP-binding protein [Lapillicoccus jejuensis]TQJ09979.1 peptide/nickel transport system ATP-binding protein/dipeptide transport system ATP-binding protein/oligopeptide transport system ATP-binding protein [Lapillicoccus jejuensis]